VAQGSFKPRAHEVSGEAFIIDSNGENKIWSIASQLGYDNGNLAINSAEILPNGFWDGYDINYGMSSVNGINNNVVQLVDSELFGGGVDGYGAAFRVHFTAGNDVGGTTIDFDSGTSELVGTIPLTQYTNYGAGSSLDTYGDTIFVNQPGDVNGDNWVGGADLSIIIGNWGLSGPTVTRTDGDLNGDQFVAGQDYSEVISYWGQGVFPYEPPEPADAPEPSTLVLMAAAGAASVAGGMRKRRRRCIGNRNRARLLKKAA